MWQLQVYLCNQYSLVLKLNASTVEHHRLNRCPDYHALTFYFLQLVNECPIESVSTIEYDFVLNYVAKFDIKVMCIS